MPAEERSTEHVPVGEDPVRPGDPPAGEPEQDRPADVARRALRAARERAGQETTGTRGTAPDEDRAGAERPAEPERSGEHRRPEKPAETAGLEVRPADLARAALRGATTPAVGERPTGASTGSDPETPDGSQASSDIGDRRGGRPGDVAREALRAARGEARRARIDAETAGAEAARRSVRPAPGRSARDLSPGDQKHDVRHLRAAAFELPADEPPATPLTGPETPDHEPRADISAPVALGDVLRAVAPRVSPVGALAGEAPEASPYEPRDTPSTPNGLGTAGTARFRQAPPTPPPPNDSRLAPSSMAAPGRDGELRRTFPALRASGDRAASPGAGLAESWWGNAWVAALEEGALDAARLVRGRGYAEKGHVDAITVTPGLVLAYVQGSRPRPYRVQVGLRTLGDQEWERFLDAAVERPGHIAALLDKEMPHSLADCGVPLLPGPGDLEPRCSCPDSGHPCKHAAALCYQTARLLDADPFVLLLLRGRSEREVLDELSRRNAARAARAAQEQQPAPFPGVRASDSLAPRTLPLLPAPLPPRPHPEPPPAYPAALGGPDPFALDQLATDAAARAHTLLTAGHDPVGELTLWQDAVRLAAARPGSGLTAGTRALYASLARAAGRTPAELARAVAAWRQGGLDGLAVLEEAWDPPAGRFDRARPLLLAADLPAFRPRRNHLTHPRGHIQLRLGRDGLWYAYESEPGHDDWWPRGTPDLDPVGALTGLGSPAEG
ncbi:SWIM zinc finger family protein [Streptomyces sp. NPDC020898]|uniref:SWIM zinc finger family protein n=1 Tax=Streptomyces sp. NPDC020898 TaxID=3365101 RepID=UPI0037901175